MHCYSFGEGTAFWVLSFYGKSCAIKIPFVGTDLYSAFPKLFIVTVLQELTFVDKLREEIADSIHFWTVAMFSLEDDN